MADPVGGMQWHVCTFGEVVTIAHFALDQDGEWYSFGDWARAEVVPDEAGLTLLRDGDILRIESAASGLIRDGAVAAGTCVDLTTSIGINMRYALRRTIEEQPDAAVQEMHRSHRQVLDRMRADHEAEHADVLASAEAERAAVAQREFDLRAACSLAVIFVDPIVEALRTGRGSREEWIEHADQLEEVISACDAAP